MKFVPHDGATTYFFYSTSSNTDPKRAYNSTNVTTASIPQFSTREDLIVGVTKPPFLHVDSVCPSFAVWDSGLSVGCTRSFAESFLAHQN